MSPLSAVGLVMLCGCQAERLLQASAQERTLSIEEYQALTNDLATQLNTERIIFIIFALAAIVSISLFIGSNSKRNKGHLAQAYTRMKAEIKEKVDELETQKELLETSNKRIQESITYAERIQHSIIPAPDVLNSYPIEESFIFYSPLDIVSGDFYWFTRKGDKLIVCCADCTGHGIPGAFMSMIASTIINDICGKANDDVSPSEILEKLDEQLINNLGKNTDAENAAAKDGLDIAIASIDLKTKVVVTSAARRPVILVRDQDIIVLKGVKRSIGDTEPIMHARPFEDTVTQLHTGDVVYMFTDGYTDQMGGDNGSKMKINRVKGMLRSVHDDDMDEQSLSIQELFTQWKGDYPQTDDVLFMGIKL